MSACSICGKFILDPRVSYGIDSNVVCRGHQFPKTSAGVRPDVAGVAGAKPLPNTRPSKLGGL